MIDNVVNITIELTNAEMCYLMKISKSVAKKSLSTSLNAKNTCLNVKREKSI